jgi:glycosyltransferase involved in cell wall biosynthesis
MKEYPRISVITPSYNQCQFIEETILSVVNQNYSNLEYIIIDGGSTDCSVEIIKKHSDKLTFWVSEKDNGQTDAINKGLALATGEIICWINSDDILLPDSLNEVANYFEKHKEYKILNGYTLRIDKKSNILFNHFVPKPLKWFATHGVYYINQPSMFFKKELIESLGFLNANYHARMDQEFVMRVLSKNYKFGKINKILAAIRIHEDTKTALNGDIWTEDIVRLDEHYGSTFKISPDFFGKVVYGILKLVSLDYLKQFLFTMKWQGKSVELFWKRTNKLS